MCIRDSHRYVQDSSRSASTEIHVRKVKDTYTGGRPTDLNNPLELKWETKFGFYGFYDKDGVCPLAPEQKGGIYEKNENAFPTSGNSEAFEGDAPF
jgi:hypothetical protein